MLMQRVKGLELRRRRNALGVSLAEMAQGAGLPRDAIDALERGQPTLQVAADYLKLLQLIEGWTPDQRGREADAPRSGGRGPCGIGEFRSRQIQKAGRR